MGVTAGVPPRVEAGVKAGLLDLVDRALEQGWTTARACAVLELDGRRCRRWQHRRSAGRLDDHTAGGTAVHAITPAERRAVLELFERWGDIDGGYRKLAHRGSYEKLVWVSPSTLYRVLAGEGLVLPARAQRTPAPARPLPDWSNGGATRSGSTTSPTSPRPRRLRHLGRRNPVARRHRRGDRHPGLVFTDALTPRGCGPPWAQRPVCDGCASRSCWLMSDNGPQCEQAPPGRPCAPSSPLRPARHPHGPGMVRPRQDRMAPPREDHRLQHAASRTSHASLGYVTPDDEHQGRGDTIRQARQDGLKRARLTRIAYHRNNNQNQP